MARIGLAGGGTGGHVYPALAIADALRARGHDIVYYGDAGRLEGRVVPERGYAFRALVAPQLPRGGILGRLRFLWGLGRSVLQVRRQLRDDGIHAILGVGGYISAPPVLAAWTLGRPRAVHEANVVPGMANRLCARVAQAVLLTYEATRHRLPGTAPRTVVGVPVHPAIGTGDRAEGRARYGFDALRPVVTFVGGSLGAARINEMAVAFSRRPGRGVQVLHLTGPKNLDGVLATYGTVPEGVVVRGYEDQMRLAYAASDLVVGRAGSSTLAELCAAGKASVLVPSPNVTENHQEENARGLVSAGAAELILEPGMDLEAAVAQVLALAGDEARRTAMGEAARSLARPDAAERAADVVESLLRDA